MLRQQLEIQNILCELMLLEKDANRIFQKVHDRATSGGMESIGQVMSGDEIDTSTAYGKLQKKLGRLPDVERNAQYRTTTYRIRDADQVRVSNEKELKRIWAEEVEIEGSRSFFDETLIKVHWIGGFKSSGAGPGNPFEIALKFIEAQPKGRIKDEISCFGYTPSQGINHKKTPVGVIVKGYTTYAFGVDAGTHMTSRATDVERRKHSGSGLHKRPQGQSPSRAAQFMIVDEQSWNSTAALEHEVIVDNWVVGGIIIPSYQGMIDNLKSKLKGIGRERQQVADQIVDKAREDFQELGRLAAETGIPFYNDKLQPIDFSGKEFETGELESEWDKALSDGSSIVTGTVTGDPEASEAVVTGKELQMLTFNSLSKPMIMRDCTIRMVTFENLKGSKITLQDCKFDNFASFESGEGSIEVRDPDRGRFYLTVYPNFKLRSATFVGCNFSNQEYGFTSSLLEQVEKGAQLKFENCEGVPDELTEAVASASSSTSPSSLFYHGPGASGVTKLSADEIAKIVRNSPSNDHMVHLNGSWIKATESDEVQKSLRKLSPSPPPPPPPPPPPLSESALRSLIQGILGESSYSRPHSRVSEVKIVSPFMWYEDRLFVVAEYERFVGGPKVKTGFYTSRGESVEDTEHMAASWQPCLGINKGDGWIKKLPGKWADPGSLLDMVSGEISKRYDDAWQRQKRAEIYGQLRREKRGMSRSEISETQIDIINSEFGRHGALFDKSFKNKSISGDDLDAYYGFVDRFSESALRIIEEELDRFDDRAIVVLGSTFAGPVYVVAYDKRELESSLDDRRDPWERYEARNTPNYSGVIAGLTLKRTNEYGECNGAWQVSTAASNEKGWGSKVYLAAFEWLRNISSDRVSVSPSAEGMWKSLVRKGVIEPEPFDDWKNPQTPPTSDDCKVFPRRDPVLNASYRLIGSIPADVSELLRAGEDHMKSLGDMSSTAENSLKAGLGDLFVNLYDN